jgi:hypothetical protein
MALKEQKIEGVVKSEDYISRLFSTPKTLEFRSLNAKNLKGLLSYLTYLYTEGEISEKAFEALVRHAYSIYVENEIEGRIQKMLKRDLLRF